MNRKNELLARVYIVMMFFVFLSFWIIAKVFYVNVIEGDKWKSKIASNIKWKVVEGDRGTIYSADGNILATSSPLFDIRMDLLSPSEENFRANIDSLSMMISKYLRPEKSPKEWKSELVNNRRDGLKKVKKGMSFYLLKKNVDYDVLVKVKNFPLFRLGAIKGGLLTDKRTTRVRPFREIAARTIGLDRENSSKIGLEGSYDKYLKGEVVRSLMKKFPGGYWIPIQEVEDVALKRGGDLITNINIKIQDIIHDEIVKQLENTKSQAGVGIVMEVNTGKILAITNLSQNVNGEYTEQRNYAIGEKYAPGSVLKVATALSLLDDKLMKPTDLININHGRWDFRGDLVRDDEDFGHGQPVTFRNAIVHSSNVAMARMADNYYNRNIESREHFINKLKKFGLGFKSGIDINGEISPWVKDPINDKNSFHMNSIPWMAHGYEIEFAPIQILTFFNAIANNGKAMKPYLVDKIIKPNDTIKFAPEVIIQKIASDTAIADIKSFLEGVVQEGTASILKNMEVKIAGKTGTAQMNVKKEGEEVFYNSTFAGYFPADNPKYSMIIVFYKNSKSLYYASQTSVPVFGNVVKRILALQALDIPTKVEKQSDFASVALPSSRSGYSGDFKKILEYSNVKYKMKESNAWSQLSEENRKVELKKYKIYKSSMPDVRGMGARDAVYLLENLGMKVRLDGFGKVVNQSIEPNTELKPQQVLLTLE